MFSIAIMYVPQPKKIKIKIIKNPMNDLLINKLIILFKLFLKKGWTLAFKIIEIYFYFFA